MATQTEHVLNGIDVQQLSDTIDAVRDNPSMADFRFRAHTEWVEGAKSRTRIKEFYGAGQEDETRTKEFVLEGDEPAVLLGGNAAPNAVETLLHALTSCLTVGFAYNAAAQDIDVRSLEFETEGTIDLRAFLGISDEVRPGYKDIQVKYRVDADAPDEKIDELCAYVQRTSPVLDALRNPVDVKVQRVR
ncbi:MAG: OsmC family protein [Bacteroidota bacterium]